MSSFGCKHIIYTDELIDLILFEVNCITPLPDFSSGDGVAVSKKGDLFLQFLDRCAIDDNSRLNICEAQFKALTPYYIAICWECTHDNLLSV